MLNHLEGKLIDKNPAFVILDCNGIGYQIQISLNTFSKLPANALQVKLLTHITINQQDFSQTCYGFAEESERTLFRHLISVSGVGASSARMCLSSYNPLELTQYIITGNVAALKSIKGIGEKTAQRIIVDLKGKVGKTDTLPDFSFKSDNNSRTEALSALIMLGFARNVAEKAVEKAFSNLGAQASPEELIKLALKSL